MKKMPIIAGLLGLCILAAVAYTTYRFFKPRPAVDKRAVYRAGNATIQLPERRPSAGLVWSKLQYPDEYADDNWRQAELRGLDDSKNERFLDIGARALSREVTADFSYTDPKAKRPEVNVYYLRQGETFIGKLSARGLKPNFAYQMKLRGIYADREAFEKIGHVGRWRLPGPGTNYLDKVYEGYLLKELVESYLLFDFFITGPTGAVEKEFYADSTLHVLWSVNYQRTPRIYDTRPVRVPREDSNPIIYSNPHPDLSTQEIFAESEQHSLAPNNRPAVNEAFLPPGRYRAEIVLTEESFHGYGDAGFWATVMSGFVDFEVVDRPRPTPYWKSVESDGMRLSPARAMIENIRAESCTDDALVGDATSDKPTIGFVEEFDLASGSRYALTLELYTAGRHAWQVFVDHGEVLTTKPTYYVESDGRPGWQRFELEITSQGRGYIRLLPAISAGRVGVRHVGIRKIVTQ